MAQTRATAKGTVERDRCKALAEDVRRHEESTAQAARSPDMAESGVRIAFGQAKSGFVQTIATILAFGAAMLAAWFAKRSADAAHETLRLAEVGEQRQFRAYVFVEAQANVAAMNYSSQGIPSSWSFNITWRNTGLTPASRVRSRINSGFSSLQDPPAEFTFPDAAHYNPDVGGVGPQQTFTNQSIVTIHDIEQSIKDGTYLWIWAWCEYDKFPGLPRCRTEWHARITVLGFPQHQDCIFRFEIGKGFNGYDDYCYRQPEIL